MGYEKDVFAGLRMDPNQERKRDAAAFGG